MGGLWAQVFTKYSLLSDTMDPATRHTAVLSSTGASTNNFDQKFGISQVDGRAVLPDYGSPPLPVAVLLSVSMLAG